MEWKSLVVSVWLLLTHILSKLHFCFDVKQDDIVNTFYVYETFY
jgi:hypothetical protein